MSNSRALILAAQGTTPRQAAQCSLCPILLITFVPSLPKLGLSNSTQTCRSNAGTGLQSGRAAGWALLTPPGVLLHEYLLFCSILQSVPLQGGRHPSPHCYHLSNDRHRKAMHFREKTFNQPVTGLDNYEGGRESGEDGSFVRKQLRSKGTRSKWDIVNAAAHHKIKCFCVLL